jgi:hypothetical protein
MQDEWEQKLNLNTKQNDASLHTLDKNYINIEIYINQLNKITFKIANMKKLIILLSVFTITLFSFTNKQKITIYLIGDSTLAKK